MLSQEERQEAEDGEGENGVVEYHAGSSLRFQEADMGEEWGGFRKMSNG